MSEFKRYPKLRPVGYDETKGILAGMCYIFPKLDGSNGSCWLDEEGEIQAGSRNIQLTEEKTNRGFYNYIKENENIKNLLKDYPEIRLY